MRSKPGWECHESDIRDLLKLGSTPGSGNQFNAPGDGVSEGHALQHRFPLVVDCKYTEKHSYSVSLKMMEEWLGRAAELGRRFALPIRIWPRGDHRGPYDYVVLRMDDFADLMRMAGEL